MKCKICHCRVKWNEVKCPNCNALIKYQAPHPYYETEFKRISFGKKPRFNISAFLGGFWFLLYHRCYLTFFRLYAPYCFANLLLSFAFFIKLPYGLYDIWLGRIPMDFLKLCLFNLIFCLAWRIGLSIYCGKKFNMIYYKKTKGNAIQPTNFLIVIILLILLLLYLTISGTFAFNTFLNGVLYEIAQGYITQPQIKDPSFFV